MTATFELLTQAIQELQSSLHDIEFFINKMADESEEEIEALKYDLSQAEQLVEEYRMDLEVAKRGHND